VYDPHNVAAILRSVDGFGIAQVNLYYTIENFPDFGKAGTKSSASARKWVRRERVEDLSTFVADRKAAGYRFVGADRTGGSIALPEYSFADRCIIALGSEHHGMQPEVVAALDDTVHIPMTGMVESYNVSVAAAVIIYEVFRQHGRGLISREELGVNEAR
ncbi:MAG TPA: TrmH family RNA methyltransferase, partial [Firmicutes bacterium]|nr:TrmH family RNA methyltransferase [Bacillota bacterium]